MKKELPPNDREKMIADIAREIRNGCAIVAFIAPEGATKVVTYLMGKPSNKYNAVGSALSDSPELIEMFEKLIPVVRARQRAEK